MKVYKKNLPEGVKKCFAYEKGVKTLYYIRSKSLEIDECESCSA